ncbi:MAG: ATP-dependent Clp protease adaptor ClpS [Campylobacterota bacterium]|nr:ATP-dependent Clp protease adaptor ClpS [Campylobacterota bacterium]
MSSETQLQYDIKIKEPKKYRVLLLNDDYTTVDFVIDILMNIFKKSYADAERIMVSVHQKGSGVCGVYTKEIAQTKVLHVSNRAKDSGFPLKAIMEEE